MSEGVAVAIEGDGDLLVAQHLAHDLRLGACRQLQGGEGVPQVVEPVRRQLSAGQQGLELEGRDVAAPQRLTGGVAEDQVVVGGGGGGGRRRRGGRGWDQLPTDDQKARIGLIGEITAYEWLDRQIGLTP